MKLQIFCELNLATFKALNPSLRADYLPAGKYTLNTYTNLVATYSANYDNYLSSMGMLAKADNNVNKKEKID
jgi:hypothetical protein